MGLSYGQCKALGIEHLYPRKSESLEDTLRRHGAEVPKIKTRAMNDGMNKTERAFAEMLSSQDLEYWQGSLKFRLAGRTWYTPDFVIPWGKLDIVEIKGFMRDDAAVKLKVAAETYPHFRWLLVRRDGRHGWDVREVTRNGIGVHPIEVPWITGG